MQKHAAVIRRHGVGNGAAVPALAAVVRRVGVAGVVVVEAVWNGDVFPGGDLVSVPGFPGASERIAVVVPGVERFHACIVIGF